jgi:hypothetical protein
MANSNTTRIHTNCQTSSGNFNYDSPNINGTAGVGADQMSLSSGANTITCPTGAVGFTIIPPSGGSTSLTLKGVSGDTGISLSPSLPSHITVGTLPANIVITTGGTVSITIVWI